MIAASFWSLLAPAIEMAEQSELYGKNGEFSFVPVAVGFFLGSLFVYMVDVFLADHDLTPAYFHQGNVTLIYLYLFVCVVLRKVS